MSWASERSTTRIEDSAYSLMGLFNVFMPMLYGEGDRAFLRLQEEIMKQSEDYTIFAWKSVESDVSERGIFARSPAEFRGFVHHWKEQAPTQFRVQVDKLPNPAVLTSRGLQIGLPLLEERELEDRKAGTYKIALSRRGPFELSRRFPTSVDSQRSKYCIFLALIGCLNSEIESERRILCIWLRKHNDSGIFTRYYPQDLAFLPEKGERGFKIHTIYARAS